jgi:hypothetical protein
VGVSVNVTIVARTDGVGSPDVAVGVYWRWHGVGVSEDGAGMLLACVSEGWSSTQVRMT